MTTNMFPLKRKNQLDHANPLLDKRQRGLNPIEAEKTIRELEPVQTVLDNKLKEWLELEYEALARSNLDPEQRQARIHAIEFHANVNKHTEFLTNQKRQFVMEFIDWLQYRDPTSGRGRNGQANPAYVRDIETGLRRLGGIVRQGPLDVKGKDEWLANFIDKKQKYSKTLMKLRMGPHATHMWTLYDAWLYYKYILRGEKLPDESFMSDFDDYFYNKWSRGRPPRQNRDAGGFPAGGGRHLDQGDQVRNREEFVPRSHGTSVPSTTQSPAEDAAQNHEQHIQRKEEQEDITYGRDDHPGGGPDDAIQPEDNEQPQAPNPAPPPPPPEAPAPAAEAPEPPETPVITEQQIQEMQEKLRQTNKKMLNTRSFNIMEEIGRNPPEMTEQVILDELQRTPPFARHKVLKRVMRGLKELDVETPQLIQMINETLGEKKPKRNRKKPDKYTPEDPFRAEKISPSAIDSPSFGAIPPEGTSTSTTHKEKQKRPKETEEEGLTEYKELMPGSRPTYAPPTPIKRHEKEKQADPEEEYTRRKKRIDEIMKKGKEKKKSED